jgi:hypothetical protein
MASRARVDLVTIVGLGLVLMPMLTLWHEVGGHAAACAVQGGHVATIGAFYVDCQGLAGAARRIVACAGVGMDLALALVAYLAWRSVRSDLARLALWYVWLGKAFVAAGYFCFSGLTGVGDLSVAPGGGLAPLPMPWAWQAGFLIGGALLYWRLIVAGISGLNAMIGTGPETRTARRRIAHGYYWTIGVVAVLVGLLNPLGLFITVLSAAASTFGGNAGLISIGFAGQASGDARDFAVARSWAVLGLGVVVSLGFALVLGPSRSF